MNKVILIGRVGKDPENVNENIVKFSLATNENYKDKDGNKVEQTEWHNITVFGKQAGVISQYVKKGQQLALTGKIKTDTWEKDGVKKYNTNVIMQSFEFIGSNDTSNVQQTAQAVNNAIPAENDNLPF